MENELILLEHDSEIRACLCSKLYTAIVRDVPYHTYLIIHPCGGIVCYASNEIVDDPVSSNVTFQITTPDLRDLFRHLDLPKPALENLHWLGGCPTCGLC